MKTPPELSLTGQVQQGPAASTHKRCLLPARRMWPHPGVTAAGLGHLKPGASLLLVPTTRLQPPRAPQLGWKFNPGVARVGLREEMRGSSRETGPGVLCQLPTRTRGLCTPAASLSSVLSLSVLQAKSSKSPFLFSLRTITRVWLDGERPEGGKPWKTLGRNCSLHPAAHPQHLQPQGPPLGGTGTHTSMELSGNQDELCRSGSAQGMMWDMSGVSCTWGPRPRPSPNLRDPSQYIWCSMA